MSDDPNASFADYPGILGLPNVLAFDWGSDSWRVSAPMVGSGALDVMGPGVRWYPTATRLADGKLLITSGLETLRPEAVQNRSVEVYNPENGVSEVISEHHETPLSIYNQDYTHVFLLPTNIEEDFDVSVSGAPEPE